MSLPQGINFRLTSGFVTDGANEYGETAVSVSYPTTTPQGNNVGWESFDGGFAVQQRDRNAGNDPRLAGVQFAFSSNSAYGVTYRIDLPAAGSYNIRIAAGDDSSSQGTFSELLDTTTSLGTPTTGSTSASAHWKDATNVERTSAADWVANNAAVTKTFSTTICRWKIATLTQDCIVSHFYIESAGGAPAPAPFLQPAMPMPQQPFSMAPLMRGANAALAALGAALLAPIGTHAAEQATAAYREATRPVQTPVRVPLTAATRAPPPMQPAPVPAPLAYPQRPLVFAPPAVAATIPPPPAPPSPAPAPWPYAQRTAVFAPPAVAVATIPPAPAPPLPASAPWPYAQQPVVFAPPAVAATIPPAPAPPIPAPAPWPYAQQQATLVPSGSALALPPPPTTAQPQSPQLWPYAALSTPPALAPAATPTYVPPSAAAPFAVQPWPYAIATPPLPAPFAIAAAIPLAPLLVVPQPPWTYPQQPVVFLSGTPGQIGPLPPPVVVQWFTFPPWPYAQFAVAVPGSAMLNPSVDVAPPPDVTPPLATVKTDQGGTRKKRWQRGGFDDLEEQRTAAADRERAVRDQAEEEEVMAMVLALVAAGAIE